MDILGCAAIVFSALQLAKAFKFKNLLLRFEDEKKMQNVL